MVSTFDVAVVGAGMFGSAAAKYLSRWSQRVVAIAPGKPDFAANSHSTLVFGAHHDESRIVRRLGWDEIWAATDSRSANRLRDIERESGIKVFEECGSLVLIAGSISARSDAIVSRSAADNIIVSRLAESDLKGKFPHLSVPPLAGGIEGLFEEKLAGYLNPRRMVEAQLAIAQKSGATVLTGTVVSAEKCASHPLWRLAVRVADKTVEVLACNVLVATGVFTNFSPFLTSNPLDIRMYSEPNLLFEIREDDVARYRRMPCVVLVDPEDCGADNLSFYLVPPIQYPDGRWYMRIGPGMQPVVEELHTSRAMIDWYFHQSINYAQEALLTRLFRLVLPDLEPVSSRHACCVIDKTPTHSFYIGKVGDRSVNVVVGGNGHGARGSDEIGRLAALAVLEREWDFPVGQRAFSPLFKSQASGKFCYEGYLQPPFGLC